MRNQMRDSKKNIEWANENYLVEKHNKWKKMKKHI